MRDLTLNQCIDVCRSEEVTSIQMNSLSEPVDSIHQVKSKEKKIMKAYRWKVKLGIQEDIL